MELQVTSIEEILDDQFGDFPDTHAVAKRLHSVLSIAAKGDPEDKIPLTSLLFFDGDSSGYMDMMTHSMSVVHFLQSKGVLDRHCDLIFDGVSYEISLTLANTIVNGGDVFHPVTGELLKDPMNHLFLSVKIADGMRELF